MPVAGMPFATMNEERVNELLRLVDELKVEDMGEDSYGSIDQWREEVREAVLHLPNVEDWGVCPFRCPDLPYELLLTGTIFRGADPPESTPFFVSIMECQPVWDRLAVWAKADAEAHEGGSDRS